MWHDGGGSSPSWFLNHVMVKDIVDGSSWTFLAQCWLAVDEGDGQVERKLLALDRQITFREVSVSTVPETLFCEALISVFVRLCILTAYSIIIRNKYNSHTIEQTSCDCLHMGEIPK